MEENIVNSLSHKIQKNHVVALFKAVFPVTHSSLATRNLTKETVNFDDTRQFYAREVAKDSVSKETVPQHFKKIALDYILQLWSVKTTSQDFIESLWQRIKELDQLDTGTTFSSDASSPVKRFYGSTKITSSLLN